MKDKLVKTGHKKLYYRFLGTLRGMGFSLLAIIALASPVFIAVGISAQAAHADTVQVVEVSSEEEPANPSVE